MLILITIEIMSYRSDEDYDPQSDFFEQENRRRQLEHDNQFYNSESGQNYIRYNDARNLEIVQKGQEQNDWIKQWYFTNKIVIILIISVLMSVTVMAATPFIIALFGANVLILVALYLISTVIPTKTQVRPAISKDTAIRETARHKAYRR